MKILIKQATKAGVIEMINNGIADLSYPSSKLRRGRVQGGGNLCPTITAHYAGIVRIKVEEGKDNA